MRRGRVQSKLWLEAINTPLRSRVYNILQLPALIWLEIWLDQLKFWLRIWLCQSKSWPSPFIHNKSMSTASRPYQQQPQPQHHTVTVTVTTPMNNIKNSPYICTSHWVINHRKKDIYEVTPHPSPPHPHYKHDNNKLQKQSHEQVQQLQQYQYRTTSKYRKRRKIEIIELYVCQQVYSIPPLPEQPPSDHGHAGVLTRWDGCHIKYMLKCMYSMWQWRLASR